jgi:hypothetical protein
MKLRIAQMGDGMFEVQEYHRSLFYGWRWVNIDLFGYQYPTLQHAQCYLQNKLRDAGGKELARTVVRVWE